MRERKSFRNALFLGSLAGMIAAGSAALAADSVVSGFGTEVPLGFAVRQIVPPGHTISYGAGVDVNAVVSWDGGRPWGEVLNQVAYNNGLAVNRHDKNIRLTVVPPLARNDSPGPHAIGGGGFSIVPYRGPTDTSPDDVEVIEMAPIEVVADAPALEQIETVPGLDPISLVPDSYEPPPPPLPSWPVEAGLSLRGVLEDWTEKAGWGLIWESEYEYPLEASATFQGEFVVAASELIASMRHARPTVTAKFYQGNRVLVIGNASLDSVN